MPTRPLPLLCSMPAPPAAGVACTSTATGNVLSMFPWMADKLAGPASPLKGCAKALSGLGYYFDPLPAMRCENGVPADLISKLA